RPWHCKILHCHRDRRGRKRVLVSSMIVAALIAWPPADESNSHWAFQARGAVAAPAIADRFVRTPIDAFVLDKLRKVGLAPAPDAERGVLVRRLFFDLTGLP